MKVVRRPGELDARPRAVALGTFDGVHRGHRRVLDAAVAAGQAPTVVTFDPHPRVALGYGVELLTYADWANRRGPFEALQLILPDSSGRWPEDPDYNAYAQPLLG